MKKIEVEDFGASLAKEIKILSKALRNTPLTDRAIAVLVRDKTGQPLTVCIQVIEVLKRLDRSYTKNEQ